MEKIAFGKRKNTKVCSSTGFGRKLRFHWILESSALFDERKNFRWIRWNPLLVLESQRRNSKKKPNRNLILLSKMMWLRLLLLASCSSSCYAAEASNDALSKSTKKNVIVSQFVLPVSLEIFERMFVDDTASLSIEDFHRKSMDKNIQLSKWLPSPSPKQTTSSSREISFLRPIRGMASTRAIKIQNYTRVGKHGCILSSSTKLKDVPGADTFTVDESLEVRSFGANSVSLQISWELHWLRESFFKSLIESNTNNAMQQWHTDYLSTMLEVYEPSTNHHHQSTHLVKTLATNYFSILFSRYNSTANRQHRPQNLI